jgi:hypothetical protein
LLLLEPRWEDLRGPATTANYGVASAIMSVKATVALEPRLSDLAELLEPLESYSVLYLTSRVAGRRKPQRGLMRRCCAVAPRRT